MIATTIIIFIIVINITIMMMTMIMMMRIVRNLVEDASDAVCPNFLPKSSLLALIIVNIPHLASHQNCQHSSS